MALRAGFMLPSLLAGGWCNPARAGTRTPGLPALGPPSLLTPSINKPLDFANSFTGCWQTKDAGTVLPKLTAIIRKDTRSPIAYWDFKCVGTPGEPCLLSCLAGMACHQQSDEEESPTQDPQHQHSVTQSFTRVHGHLLARLVISTGTLQTTTTAKTPKEHDASPHERKPATAIQSGRHSGTNMRL